MDPTPTTSPSPTNKNCNTPDTENETPPAPPPPPQQSPPLNKPLFQFTNGALKNQNQKQLHHLFNHHPAPIPASAEAIGYKECLKNHAAAMGGHAVDGCGEFMPSPTFNPTDPTSLKCAACGCHRNFHRRDDDDYPQSNLPLEFHPRFPALLPPPPIRRSSPFSSPSPPPMPSYYGSAPNMLLALSTAVAEEHPGLTPVTPTAAKSENPNGRKRFRTRFSSEQKEKMHSFSEKLGWKMQKSNEGLVEEFCNEIGVRRGVLKVWMHNNKNTFGRRETMMNSASANGDGTVPNFGSNNGHNNNNNSNMNGHEDHKNGVHHPHVSSSGSPSSA